MVSIIKATEAHSAMLSEIAKKTFIESHGSSASPEDINTYVAEKYSTDILRKELREQANNYYILYYNGQAAGYSKVVLNSPFSGSSRENIAKLERLYLLKEFYNQNLGSELFEFTLNFAKGNNQSGIWLFVWKENQRAVNFYTKNGFTIIGSHDFKISETHSNPNHQMLLDFV